LAIGSGAQALVIRADWLVVTTFLCYLQLFGQRKEDHQLTNNRLSKPRLLVTSVHTDAGPAVTKLMTKGKK